MGAPITEYREKRFLPRLAQMGNALELVSACVLFRLHDGIAPPHGGTSLTSYDRKVTMKSVVRHVMWSSMLLVLVMAFYLGTVHAQEQGRSDQPTPPGNQAGEIPGQGGMGERGQMT